MKRTIWIVFAVFFLFSVSVGAATLTGKYYLISMEIEGETFNDKLLTSVGFDLDDCYLEFLDSGKFILRIMDDVGEGIFKVDGKTITITGEGDFVDIAMIDGNKITLGDDEAIMIFEKR